MKSQWVEAGFCWLPKLTRLAECHRWIASLVMQTRGVFVNPFGAHSRFWAIQVQPEFRIFDDMLGIMVEIE